MAIKITSILKKLSRPLRTIEYIISIGILWAGLIAVALLSQPDTIPNSSAFTSLIEEFELVSIAVLIMVVLAIIDLVALSLTDSIKSIGVRAGAMFWIAVGFFFVSILTVISSGVNNLLWANEFNLGLIAAILYINLKVNHQVEYK